MRERTLPHNSEAERQLLGCCLRYPETLAQMVGRMKPEFFFEPRNQSVYLAMATIARAGKVCDLIVLADTLERQGELEKVGGAGYLMELGSSAATSVNAGHYAGIVKERYDRRWLIRACQEIIQSAFDDPDEAGAILGRAQARLMENDAREEEGRFIWEGAHDYVEWIGRMYERAEKGERFLGDIKTGFHQVDAITGGHDKPEFVGICAPSSVGKTAFALSVAENCAESGRMTAVFSIEMGQVRTERRQLSSMSHVSISEIRRGNLLKSHIQRIMKKCNDLTERQFPLWITGDVYTLNQICAKAQWLKMRYGLEVLVIDYFQLIDAEKTRGTKNDELEDISGTLKQLGKKLEIVIFLLAQFNQTGIKALQTGNPHPDELLTNLRGSGRLGNDLDCAIALWRDPIDPATGKPKEVVSQIEYHGDMVKVVERHGMVFKQRDGYTERFEVPLLLDYIRFLDKDDEAAPF